MNIVESSPFVSKLKSGGSNESDLRYDLSCELYRISTFSTFPLNVPVSERSLARAGFYYTGLKDKVKCFSCGLMLDNWKKGDSALDKHKQLYPSCNFVQSLASANSLSSSFHSAFSPPVSSVGAKMDVERKVPSLEQGGYFSGHYASFPQDPVTSRALEDLSCFRPKSFNPSMKTEAARRRTYQGWPLPFLAPSDLAKAGFYYVGPLDRVACFACGGQLGNWDPEDDAMSEHRRHFPSCPFVKNLYGDLPSFSVANLRMQTHSARVSTFTSWPLTIPVRPQQLADAGFYYVGKRT